MQFEIYFVQGPTLRRSAENENQKSPGGNRFPRLTRLDFSSFSNPQQVSNKREQVKVLFFELRFLGSRCSVNVEGSGVRDKNGFWLTDSWKNLRGNYNDKGKVRIRNQKCKQVSVLILCIYSYSLKHRWKTMIKAGYLCISF